VETIGKMETMDDLVIDYVSSRHWSGSPIIYIIYVVATF